MIVFVNNDDALPDIDCHASWSIKLSVPSPGTTEHVVEGSIRIEYLNTVVASISDHQVTLKGSKGANS